MKIAMSSGHGKYVRGASGYLDEVDEARRIVEKTAEYLRNVGVVVVTYHDDQSKTQDENLNRIVDFHNDQIRDYDVSVHLNAYVTTDKPMGTECLYYSQETLATAVAQKIAAAGSLINRGPKHRADLFFLNNTDAPAVLIETCFVDSRADADLYDENFAAICAAISTALSGVEQPSTPGPEPEPPYPPVPDPVPDVSSVDISIAADGPVRITINGRTVRVGGENMHTLIERDGSRS